MPSGESPITSTGVLAPGPSIVEQLRAQMQAAPDYRDDFDEGGESLTHHRVGMYPPDGDTPGIVIAEQIIPEQELVDDKNDRQYNWASRATNDYLYANSFVIFAETPELALPVKGLGFSARSIVTDARGSRLIAARYPSAKDFNGRLQRVGHTAITLELELETPHPTARQQVEALAEGKLLATKAIDMLTQISVQGLMSASTMRLLRDSAKYALEQPAPDPLETTDFAWPLRDDVRHTASILHGINTVKKLTELTRAMNDPNNGSVTPTPVEELGYELKNAVRRPDFEPADHGLSLAEDTVRHMQALAKIA